MAKLDHYTFAYKFCRLYGVSSETKENGNVRVYRDSRSTLIRAGPIHDPNWYSGHLARVLGLDKKDWK